MKLFLLNILLAAVWIAATGTFTLAGAAIGFGLGYLIIGAIDITAGSHHYAQRLPKAVVLAAFYLRELAMSNIRVALDVLTPRHRMRPAVIDIPLDARTDAEIAILANMITMTPGTLSLDVSNDRRTLWIHAMYVDDVDEFRERIKRTLERRLLEVMR